MGVLKPWLSGNRNVSSLAILYSHNKRSYKAIKGFWAVKNVFDGVVQMPSPNSISWTGHAWNYATPRGGIRVERKTVQNNDEALTYTAMCWLKGLILTTR